MSVIIDGHTGAIKTLSYEPGLQDTGGLELGVNTVVLMAEAAGLGAADYNAALTLPAPTDSRINVLAVAFAMVVSVAVADGNLRCRVYVDAQDADHMIFDETLAGVAWHTFTTTVTAAALPIAFALLTDGAAHTFYMFLWKDGLGAGAQVDVVDMIEAVGANDTGTVAVPIEVLTIDGIRGWATFSATFDTIDAAGAAGQGMTYITSPKGGVTTEDIVVAGPTGGPRLLSNVQGFGNWWNARAAHTVGSVGLSMSENSGWPGYIEYLEYIYILWNEVAE